MEKEFDFIADSMNSALDPGACRCFEVTIDVTVEQQEWDFEFVSILDVEINKRYQFEDLPDGERLRLMKRANEVAEKSAYDVWDNQQSDYDE